MDRAIPGGFATAFTVWLVAFVGRLPALGLPGPVLFGLLMAVMLTGAIIAGRRGRRRALTTMLITGAINVLLVGSVAAASKQGFFIWIPGSLAVSALIGVIGGLIGERWPVPRTGPRPESTVGQQRRQALVIIASTFALISVGGIVTSVQAGLSVPDWPNSYGYNMFLFPFTKMVGGIYFEHAHRLLGSLVGLETLVLCIWILTRPPGSASARRLAIAALALVIVQGGLGGMRVVVVNHTGNDVALALAVTHACTAQLFLLSIGVLAWRLDHQAERRAWWIGAAVVALAVIQTLLGALVRHFHLTSALIAHVLGALVVTAAVVALVRHAAALGNANTPQPIPHIPPVRPVRRLAAAIAVQVPLGVVVWWLTTQRDELEQVTSGWIAAVTAAHVVTGAAIVLLCAWAALALAPTVERADPHPGGNLEHRLDSN